MIIDHESGPVQRFVAALCLQRNQHNAQLAQLQHGVAGNV